MAADGAPPIALPAVLWLLLLLDGVVERNWGVLGAEFCNADVAAAVFDVDT